jgi:hypothetical protein
LRQALDHLFDLDADDLFDRLGREDVKDDYLVDAVEELGAEVVFKRLLHLFLGHA